VPGAEQEVRQLAPAEAHALARRKRRAQVIDRTAAAWILQGALDRLRA
jgi:RNase H-fold protein (predicted Holliday junction resolvase)